MGIWEWTNLIALCLPRGWNSHVVHVVSSRKLGIAPMPADNAARSKAKARNIMASKSKSCVENGNSGSSWTVTPDRQTFEPKNAVFYQVVPLQFTRDQVSCLQNGMTSWSENTWKKSTPLRTNWIQVVPLQFAPDQGSCLQNGMTPWSENTWKKSTPLRTKWIQVVPLQFTPDQGSCLQNGMTPWSEHTWRKYEPLRTKWIRLEHQLPVNMWMCEFMWVPYLLSCPFYPWSHSPPTQCRKGSMFPTGRMSLIRVVNVQPGPFLWLRMWSQHVFFSESNTHWVTLQNDKHMSAFYKITLCNGNRL